MNTPEQNKELIRSHYEELSNRKNLDAADEQVAPDFIDHGAPPDAPHGPEGVKAWMRTVYAAFPDLSVVLEDVVAEGDRVAVRAVWSGTHQGPIFGVPATGKHVTFGGMVFWRIDGDGRIAERWAYLDTADLMRQLGGPK